MPLPFECQQHELERITDQLLARLSANNLSTEFVRTSREALLEMFTRAVLLILMTHFSSAKEALQDVTLSQKERLSRARDMIKIRPELTECAAMGIAICESEVEREIAQHIAEFSRMG